MIDTSSFSGACDSVIGCERDMEMRVFNGLGGQVFASEIFLISGGYFDGQWTVSSPTSSSFLATIQYDGIDTSFNLEINGLASVDLTDGGLADTLFVAAVSNTNVVYTADFYSPDGALCQLDINVAASTGYYDYSSTFYEFPLSSISGTCDINNIGAIEISLPSVSAVDSKVRRISILGPDLSPTPSQTPTNLPSLSSSETPTPEQQNPSASRSTAVSSILTSSSTKTFTPTGTQTPAPSPSQTLIPTSTPTSIPSIFTTISVRVTPASTSSTPTPSSQPPNSSGSPSQTQTRTPTSLSRTQSATTSQTVPSATPFQSVNIAHPTLLPPKLPSVSRAIATPISSPIASQSAQYFSMVQPTTAPANQGPVSVRDGNGHVVVEVEFLNQRDGTVIVSPGENNPNAEGSRFVHSLSLSLVLVNDLRSEIQPSGKVEICIDAPDAKEDQSCLGFLNENKSPPVWECQDSCLSRNSNNFLCGKTDHFTSFALLFNGKGRSSSCSDSNDLIFDKPWKDGVLIASISVTILIFLLCVTIILAVTPCGSRLIRGSEGYRISKLRNSALELSS